MTRFKRIDSRARLAVSSPEHILAVADQFGWQSVSLADIERLMLEWGFREEEMDIEDIPERRWDVEAMSAPSNEQSESSNLKEEVVVARPCRKNCRS